MADVVDVGNTAEQRSESLLFLGVVHLGKDETVMDESCGFALELTLIYAL